MSKIAHRSVVASGMDLLEVQGRGLLPGGLRLVCQFPDAFFEGILPPLP